MNRQQLLDALYETAQSLYDAGVMDQMTVRKFDAASMSEFASETEPQAHDGEPETNRP